MRLSRLSIARWLAAGSFIALAGTLSLPAQAQSAYPQQKLSPKATLQARQQAEEQTRALMAQYKGWQQARGADKSRALGKLVEQAEARQRLLAELAKTQPAEVLRVAIPADKQRGMPEEVRALLEQKLELEGELEATYIDVMEDFSRSHLRHELITPFGERVRVHFAGRAPELPFGSEVRAKGLLLATGDESGADGVMVLGEEDDSLYPIAYAGADGSVNTSLSPVANNTFGEVRTLVLLVNFQDKREQPYTQAFARDMVFNQVSAYFQENSYGQSGLAGDVTPWITLPISTTDSMLCYGSYLADHADQAARNAGYNPDNYDRLMYVFPNAGCGWSGSAQVGGKRSWIQEALNFRITAHELGHNYGLSHSHSLYCSNGTSIGTGGPDLSSWEGNYWEGCRQDEYGHTLDIMGNSPSAHFHANQKELLGWLEYGQSPDITTITQSGSYEIDVLASQAASNKPKALKVLKAVNPSNGEKTWYYIELRQPVGFDSIVGEDYFTSRVHPENVTNGVLVHAVHGVGSYTQWLLDMTPETTTMKPRDPALEVGRSFYSPDGDLSLTTEWVDSGKAVVHVALNGAPAATCSRARPTVAVTPGQSDWLAAGTAYSYRVTITNNDSGACAGSSFSLGSIKPSGWSAGLGSGTLSLAPGASGSTSLTVTSPASAGDGFYNVGVQASANGLSQSGSATYVIDSPVTGSNRAPVAADDTASTQAGTAVTIAVLANDLDPDGDVLKVVGVTQGGKGSVAINSNGTLTYTPAKSFKTGDSFGYTVSDGKATASAQVTIALEQGTESSSPGKGSGRNK